MNCSNPLKRRVVAISSTGVANTQNTQCDHITTALCNDGSVWELRDNTANPEWRRLPSIPQPKSSCERPT